MTFDQLAAALDECGEHEKAQEARRLMAPANRIVIDQDRLIGYQVDGTRLKARGCSR